MESKLRNRYMVPYILWIMLFVVAPIVLIGYRSLFDIDGNLTLSNYREYFTNMNYIKMSINSVIYALLITVFTLLVSYPTAYFLSKSKYKNLLLLFIILPTWINLLLKAYAFIGIFGIEGEFNNFLTMFGIAPKHILFTDFSFIFVACYIELPFMIIPIFNSIEDINPSYLEASRDLGADSWTTFRRIVFPLTTRGVKAGVQAVFIPSLSLFMLTRLIGGNRVITLGTAIEEHFLVTQNWGMGSTIGVVLIIAMIVLMLVTGERNLVGRKR